MAAKSTEAEIGTEDLIDQVKKVNLNNEQNIKQVIPIWLKDFESPFLWDSKEKKAKTGESIINRCLDKLEELNIEEYDLCLIRYAVLLKLIVEYTYLENDDQANDTMDIIKNCIKKEEKQKYPQYEKFKTGLDHVILTTEAHLLALQGLEDQSREVSLTVLKIEKLPNHTKAVIFALKSNFFQYSGLEHAEDLAVENARQALELEPDFHEWMFLLAKMLRQQRKEFLFNTEIPREEIVLLEKVVAQAEYPHYLEYLAQVYQESSAKVMKRYKNDSGFFKSNLFRTITEMQRKSLNYFKRVLDMKPTSPAILRRIGYGIMQLPKKITDYDLALKCLLESASMCENNKTLHILGTFYHRYGNDNKKALEYYEKTANNGCFVGLTDMIRVKFLVNPHYDPREDIEKGLQWECNKNNRKSLLVQEGGYYLFIKQDFLKSIECFNKVINEDKDSVHMTTYKCIFLRMNETINLYQYLANEAMLYLKKNNNNEEVKALLETIENIHPKFTNKEPDPNLITKLCLMSEEIKNKEKSLKERGHQTQNRRENQRGDNSCNRRSSGNSERPFYGSWRSDDRNQVGSQRGRSWRSDDRNQERSQRERSWRSDDRNQDRSQRERSWRSDDRNQDRSQRERNDNYNRGQNRSRSDEEKGFWRRQE